jgi:hypothetical protein
MTPMAVRKFIKRRHLRHIETETPPTKPQVPAIMQYTLPSGRVCEMDAHASAIFERSLDIYADIWADLAKS